LESRAYLVAEMENVRRIAKVDVDKARTYAAQPIAKGLLLAVDNLSITSAAITPDLGAGNPAVAALGEGVGATLKIFLKVLGEHGVAQFGAPGEKFNPNVHEAVAMLPAQADQQPNTVVNVLKVGYMFKDRVLRPAQVTVAMKSSAMDEAKAAVDATAGSSRSL
jgi:molecular chaperone GrpE